MTNSTNGIQKEIKVKRQKLIAVISINYLGAVVSDDGSTLQVFSRIAQATAALTKLKPVWRDKLCLRNISWIKRETDVLPCHFHITVCL